MFRLFVRPLFAIMLIAMFGVLPLAGQLDAGSFSGQVTDPDGGVIPAATVQIVNQDHW